MRSRDSRRSFLKQATLFSITAWPAVSRAASAFLTKAASRPAVDLAIKLRAAPSTVSLYPDRPTDVWAYDATVMSGEAARVRASGNGFLGPVIELHKGERLTVEYINDIPEESTRTA